MKSVLYSIIASLCLVLCGCSPQSNPPQKDPAPKKQASVEVRDNDGQMVVSKVSIPKSIFSEGQSGVTALSFSVEAKQDDLTVGRVKVDLGAEKEVYTKLIKALYFTDDAGKTLALAELNDNTVVYDSGRYYLVLGGFESQVPKGTKKYFTFKADIYDGINASTKTFASLQLPPLAVRAVDGKKNDLYGPSQGHIAQNVSVELRQSGKG